MAKDGWLDGIAQDLLNLEINTILKDSITARKMPPLPIAVLEIAGDYYWCLRAIAGQLGRPAVIESLLPLAPETRTNAPWTFDRLREASRALMADDDDNSGRAALLERIYRISSAMPTLLRPLVAERPELWGKTLPQLLAMPEQIDSLKARPDQITFVRKAWEIGTEVVVAQSVIHLDGDVISRIHPGFIGPDHAALRQMHLDACEISIRTWGALVRLVKDILTSAFRELRNIFVRP